MNTTFADAPVLLQKSFSDAWAVSTLPMPRTYDLESSAHRDKVVAEFLPQRSIDAVREMTAGDNRKYYGTLNTAYASIVRTDMEFLPSQIEYLSQRFWDFLQEADSDGFRLDGRRALRDEPILTGTLPIIPINASAKRVAEGYCIRFHYGLHVLLSLLSVTMYSTDHFIGNFTASLMPPEFKQHLNDCPPDQIAEVLATACFVFLFGGMQHDVQDIGIKPLYDHLAPREAREGTSMYAGIMASIIDSARLAIIAHEYAHILNGDCDDDVRNLSEYESHQQEFSADRDGMFLLAYAGSMFSREFSATAVSTAWTLRQHLCQGFRLENVIQGVPIFFALEEMIDQTAREFGYDTTSETHPPAAERIRKIREHIVEDPVRDADAGTIFDEMVCSFEELVPIVNHYVRAYVRGTKQPCLM